MSSPKPPRRFADRIALQVQRHIEHTNSVKAIIREVETEINNLEKSKHEYERSQLDYEITQLEFEKVFASQLKTKTISSGPGAGSVISESISRLHNGLSAKSNEDGKEAKGSDNNEKGGRITRSRARNERDLEEGNEKSEQEELKEREESAIGDVNVVRITDSGLPESLIHRGDYSDNNSIDHILEEMKELKRSMQGGGASKEYEANIKRLHRALVDRREAERKKSGLASPTPPAGIFAISSRAAGQLEPGEIKRRQELELKEKIRDYLKSHSAKNSPVTRRRTVEETSAIQRRGSSIGSPSLHSQRRNSLGGELLINTTSNKNSPRVSPRRRSQMEETARVAPISNVPMKARNLPASFFNPKTKGAADEAAEEGSHSRKKSEVDEFLMQFSSEYAEKHLNANENLKFNPVLLNSSLQADQNNSQFLGSNQSLLDEANSFSPIVLHSPGSTLPSSALNTDDIFSAQRMTPSPTANNPPSPYPPTSVAQRFLQQQGGGIQSQSNGENNLSMPNLSNLGIQSPAGSMTPADSTCFLNAIDPGNNINWYQGQEGEFGSNGALAENRGCSPLTGYLYENLPLYTNSTSDELQVQSQRQQSQFAHSMSNISPADSTTLTGFGNEDVLALPNTSSPLSTAATTTSSNAVANGHDSELNMIMTDPDGWVDSVLQ
eukprot:Nk52_evm1s1072 gene=Nk52_evmTU1s1072